jgi:alcohol dehydrogenase class IV
VTVFTHDSLPNRIVFGVGAIDRVADEVARLGVARALLISSPSSKGVADGVAARLGSRLAGRFDEVRQHVPEALAAAARAHADDAGADGVVAVGGGSATGLGKAVVVDAGIPLLAIPTTYAGSEVTPIFGITGEHKRTGRDLRALPRVVVYDPALTTGLSPQVTATTGFNALAHCVEALYAPGANPVLGLHALEGIRALASGLPRAVLDPDDLDARTTTLYGAYLAGVALAGAGTALHHKLCHVLGGTFGLVHGECNAVVLPHVVAYNCDQAPHAMAEVASALSDAGVGRGTTAPDAAVALHDLADRLGAPTSLRAIGMPEAGLDRAAELAVAETGTGNPRVPDVASLRALLQRAFDGEAPAPT